VAAEENLREMAGVDFSVGAPKSHQDVIGLGYEWFAEDRTRSTEAIVEVVPYIHLFGPILYARLEPHVLERFQSHSDQAR